MTSDGLGEAGIPFVYHLFTDFRVFFEWGLEGLKFGKLKVESCEPLMDGYVVCQREMIEILLLEFLS